MSKIVQAVNSMISNAGMIGPVIQNNNEYFFVYKDKYRWSVSRRDNESHQLWYYPGDLPIEVLAGMEGHDWEMIPMVKYSDTEIGTKEAKSSFAELYTIVKERLYGVNDVLDDIISDSESF